MNDSSNLDSELLKAIINAAQILKLRSSGDANLIPTSFAAFPDAVLVKSILLDAAALLDQCANNGVEV